MDLGNVVFKIGKFKGKTFEYVSESEYNYNKWIFNLPTVTGQLAEYKRYILNKKLQQNTSSDSTATNNAKNDSSTSNIKRPNGDSPSSLSQKVNKTSLDAFKSMAKGSISVTTEKTQIGDKEYQITFIENNALTSNAFSSNNLSSNTLTSNALSNNQLASDPDAQLDRKIPLEGTISFEVFDDEHFKILHKKNHYNNRIPYQIYTNLERFNPIIHLKDNEKLVTFKYDVYNGVMEHLEQTFTFENKIEHLPGFVRRAYPNFCTGTRLKPYNISYDSAIDSALVRERIGDLLYDSLKSFQLEGVYFGISRNGKLIIGDEMGLGKTLQALAIAAYYQNDWPLLIVCPSSLRFQWKDEILNWIPHLVTELEIYTIKNSKNFLSYKSPKVVITSYDHLVRMDGNIQNFLCVICDESHFIKNKTAKRTKVLLPIMKNATRVILCSGTPSLNNPSELYHQIVPLFDKFASFNEFANSYSSIHRFSRRLIYTGCKHGDELHSFLIKTIMLRRLKKNVQKELPSKIRSKIAIEIPVELKDKISSLRAEIQNNKDHTGISKFSELLMHTCEAKRDAVCDYVNYLMDNNHKFILFAHHIMMLDSLEECVQRYGVDYIRIDGTTNQNKREDLVKKFQTSQDCKIAILSLTACGQGLNLTAASIVVMTELYWVPGLLFQAEDRAHRIGAQNIIHVHYLIAKYTLDEAIWKLVSKKWKDVSKTLDGKKETILLNPEDINDTQSSILSYLVQNNADNN